MFGPFDQYHHDNRKLFFSVLETKLWKRPQFELYYIVIYIDDHKRYSIWLLHLSENQTILFYSVFCIYMIQTIKQIYNKVTTKCKNREELSTFN